MTEGCFVFLNVARIHSLLSDHYDRHKLKFSIILNVKIFTNGMVSLVLSIGKCQEWWTPFGWGRGPIHQKLTGCTNSYVLRQSGEFIHHFDHMSGRSTLNRIWIYDWEHRPTRRKVPLLLSG